MKTAGIIAEYNPFHNGHLYQIQQLRAQTGADYVIAAISGDFVQRGEPAIYDKYTRTCMALNAGADLVLELPAAFAVSSAEDFAACGVALFEQLGIVDLLCFGSECGELAPLWRAARLLSCEPEAFQTLLKEYVSQGISFPQARQLAMEQWFKKDANGEANAPWGTLLSTPNNILAIEYLKALLRQNSRMTPYTILRQGRGYHDQDLDVTGGFSSASAIRNALQNGSLEAALDQMPIPPADAAGQISQKAIPIFSDDFSGLLNYRLLELTASGQDLQVFSDVSPELADRIRAKLLQFDSFSGRIESLKTRQYTYTRISRALLHILLGITRSQVDRARADGYVSYVRILGFRRDAAPLMGHLKAHCRLPLITKTADAQKRLSPESFAAFSQDLYASHLYQSVVQQKSGVLLPNEFTRSVILV